MVFNFILKLLIQKMVLQIISNFLFLICKAKKNWNIAKIKKKLINNIRKTVGSNKVICALSGGVDSSVVAQLIQ